MSHGGDIYRNKVDMDYSVNLNPLGTPQEIKDALVNSLCRSAEYPDSEQSLVRSIAARAEGLLPENVMAGCGATELLMAAVEWISPQKALLFAPCYTGYERALKSFGTEIVYRYTDRSKCFELSADDLEAIEDDIDVVIICDPVNPTGRNIAPELMEELFERACSNNARVILDESFYHMSEGSEAGYGAAGSSRTSDLLKRYDNLFVLRSFTKLFAVPGIRAGILLASTGDVAGVRSFLPEWNLPVTSEAVVTAGYELMEESDFLERTMEAVRSGRKYLTDSIKSLGLRVYESDTSFILFEGPRDLGTKMLEKGILIRECSDFEGLSEGFYRICTGNEDNNRRFMEILGDSIV